MTFELSGDLNYAATNYVYLDAVALQLPVVHKLIFSVL